MTRRGEIRARPVHRAAPTTIALLLAVTLVLPGCPSTAELEEEGVADGDCCSCEFTATETFSANDGLPCVFDVPAGWRQIAGDDGAMVSGVAGAPPCPERCDGSPGITFSVAKRPNRNAATMEQAWTGIMRVVGSARCGDREVTFFETPGSEADGLLGGLRFHVGSGGESYSATATFSCSEPGEWRLLRELFVDTFTTNQGTTFGQE